MAKASSAFCSVSVISSSLKSYITLFLFSANSNSLVICASSLSALGTRVLREASMGVTFAPLGFRADTFALEILASREASCLLGGWYCSDK